MTTRATRKEEEIVIQKNCSSQEEREETLISSKNEGGRLHELGTRTFKLHKMPCPVMMFLTSQSVHSFHFSPHHDAILLFV